MPVNTAAWVNGKRARLEMGPAPYTRPGDDQIVVRNHAVAINPLDWIIQVEGNLTYRWLKYTIVLERMAAPIPDTLPFEEAAVLPLAVSTASCGLFQTDQLGLRHPRANAAPTRETVLVWGGSTSVGSNAIQLAVAAGYEVITTASPRNFDYVKALGASQVFDYNSPSVVPDIIAAVKGRTFAGAIAFGATSAASCVKIAGSCQGKKFVSMASPPVSFHTLADLGRGRFAFPRLMLALITSNVAVQFKARSRGVRTKYIFGTTLKTNEVAAAIYRDFLPSALAEGRYVAAPKPSVAGKGVHDFQRAMDVQLKGVSAAKVVVTLP